MYNEDNMTTDDHAKLVAESIINGQHKQARAQYTRALHDGCSANALATDMQNYGLSAEDVIKFLTNYIEIGGHYGN